MADLDPLAVHELLHGASLAADLFERAAWGEVYDPIWALHPEAREARDRAMDALVEFYQAMGRVSVASEGEGGERP